MVFEKYNSVIFDWDGTIAYGNSLIPESIDLMKEIMNNTSVYILTNSSSRSSEQIREILAKENISIKTENIITGNEIAIAYMKKNSLRGLYVVSKDTPYYHNENLWDAVLVAYADNLKLETLNQIKKNFNKSKKLLTLDNSPYVPKSLYFVPGSKWIVETLEEILGVKSELIGKPSLFPGSLIIERGCKKEEALFIGDSEVDKKFALNAGFDYFDIKKAWNYSKKWDILCQSSWNCCEHYKNFANSFREVILFL